MRLILFTILIMIMTMIYISILVSKYSFTKKGKKYSNNKTDNIEFLTIETRDNKMTKIHNNSLKKYSNKYGYKYTFLNDYKNELVLPIYWYKIQCIKDMLQDNSIDYLVWLDSDTFIVNEKIKIEDIINLTNSSIYIGKDYPNSNLSAYCAGVFIIKNDNIGKQFLDDCINTYINRIECTENGNYVLAGKWAGMCYEQGIMNELLNSKYKKSMFYLNEKIITNKYGKINIDYVPYIYHCFGGSKDDAAEFSEKYLQEKKDSFYNTIYQGKSYELYTQEHYNIINNKNIFCYWDDEELCPVINECIKSFKKLSNWKVMLLNNKTIYNIIEKDKFPEKYDKLKITQKTDWIRLYLLYEYGGIWMDSSIIVNNPSIIQQMYEHLLKNKLSIGSYFIDLHSLSYNNIKTYCIESWFLMVIQSHNYIIKYWLDEFEYAISFGLNNYINYTKNNYKFTKTDISYSWYFAIYQCYQVIIQKYKIDLNQIYMVNTKNDMFKHMFSYDYIKKKYNCNIKLMKRDRDYIENNIDIYRKFIKVNF
jgi:hypothetical protein